MEIKFTRTGERSYSMTAIRNDKVTVSVPGYDAATALPHDLIHYVVERELNLTQGFWGRVAAGAIFPGMAVVDGRQKPHAASRSQAVRRAASEQGTESEVLVGLLAVIIKDELDKDWPSLQKLLRNAWQPGQLALQNLTKSDVERICKALRAIQLEWKVLPVGESITVTWQQLAKSKR